MTMLSQLPRGFTVIELMIVVVVIGILSAIVVIAYRGIQQSARESRVSGQLSEARKQMENERTLTGKWAFEDAVRTEIAAGGPADGGICGKLGTYLNDRLLLSGSRGDVASIGSLSCSNTGTTGQTINGVTPSGAIIFCGMVPVAQDVMSAPAYFIITSQQIAIKKYKTYSDLSICNP